MQSHKAGVTVLTLLRGAEAGESKLESDQLSVPEPMSFSWQHQDILGAMPQLLLLPASPPQGDGTIQAR